MSGVPSSKGEYQLDTKKKPDFDKVFHRAVKAVANDTAEVFKDNKHIRKMLRAGDYEGVAHHVVVASTMQPEYDNDDIINAADQGVDGLVELAVDADYADKVVGLAMSWTEIEMTKQTLPRLTWPKGIKIAK